MRAEPIASASPFGLVGGGDPPMWGEPLTPGSGGQGMRALLPQPCGFEGCKLVRVGADTHDLATAEGKRHGQGRELGSDCAAPFHWRWLRINSRTDVGLIHRHIALVGSTHQDGSE